jgi:hypothetical protein
MWHTANNLNVDLRPDECRTVLVLGAGASSHLGFPLGPELLSTIIKNTSDPDGNFFKELLGMNFSQETIRFFREHLEKSFPHSVDEFFENRPEFIDVGRASIAQVLIEREDESLLRNRDDNWYRLLRDRIKGEIDGNGFRPVIVTFNYDLSLEKFLYDFLSSTFPRYATINTLTNVVRILHVHGRLGYLDYEAPRTPSRSYGGPVSRREILAASQGIRVPSQLTNDYGGDMVYAQEAIKQAKRVIFLGFGYDDRNLHRLRVDNWEPGKYFGTAYGLGETRIQRLLNVSQERLSLAPSTLRIYDYLASAACWNDDYDDRVSSL